MTYTKLDHYFQNHCCVYGPAQDCEWCSKHMVRQSTLRHGEGGSSQPNPHPPICKCQQYRIDNHLASG